jgi:hypothetical protein
MAVKIIETREYSCDLCGSKREEDELTQFQMAARGTPPAMTRDTQIGADVCEGCLSRPVAEVKAFIEAAMERKGLRTVPVSLIS